MKLKLFLILTLGLLGFSACSDVKRGEQLAKINQLNASLDSIKLLVESNPLDSANLYAQISHDVELRIKNNYFADTINMVLGKKMDAYKVMRRKWAPLGYDYRNLLQGVKETKESLRQLKHDIENGDGDRSKYDEFLSFETEKVNQLKALAEQYIDTRRETYDTFHTLHEELNQFSIELLKKAEASKK